MKPEAQILKKAIRKLKWRGVDTTGRMISDDGAYCLVGSIYAAAGCPDSVLRAASPVPGPTVPFIFEGNADAVMTALKAVEKVIRRREFGGKRDAYRGIYGQHGLAQYGYDFPDLVIPAFKQALLEVR